MFQCGFSLGCFQQEDIAHGFQRLHRLGYDFAEVPGCDTQAQVNKIKALSRQCGLPCLSINGHYTKERDLSSHMPAIRGKAVAYVKQLVDQAVELGAKMVIAVPTHVGKHQPQATMQAEWEFAVDSLRECGRYAAEMGITIVLEPINRFEVYLVNTLAAAVGMIKAVGLSSVRVMGDTFHMLLQERDPIQAIKHSAEYLIHFHISDSTREAPGMGSQNLLSILNALYAVGYQGELVLEYDPQEYSQYGSLHKTTNQTVYDASAQTAIIELRRLLLQAQSAALGRKG